MIKCKSKNKCQVFSKSGKPLSKAGMTKKAAERRLKQVEMFKNTKNELS